MYKVVAPCVLAKDQQGYVQHKYEGQLIEWLSDEQARDWLAGEEPLVEKVGGRKSRSKTEPEGVGDPDAEPAGDEAPLHAAPKAAWVKYAISKGADPTEAEATNKPDLIELYGG